MSRLLRSLKFTDYSCCWRNISVSLRAISVAALFVFWGAGSAFAQGEFPCELEISCPSTANVECGSENDLDLTGTVQFDVFNCQSDAIALHADVVIASDGCNSTILRTWTVSVVGGPSEVCVQVITTHDTTGPVFADVPADVTYQCISEIPDQVTLEATDACGGVDEVISFDSNSGFDTLSCTLTTPVGPGPDWAVWLNGLAALGLASNDYYTWVPGTATMSYYNDGTAYLTGDVQNMSNAGETWTVYFWMENGMNWTDWSAMGRSYKDDLGFGASTHTAWTYYDLVPVFSHFVGTGSNTGNSLYLSHQPTNHYFGFQFGAGANNRNNHDGGSGWFYYWGWVNGEYVNNHGDLTTDKECVPVEHPQGACETAFTRFWRATDNCGNVTFEQQDIVVHDTEAPEFQNCYESFSIECDEDIPAALPAEDLIAIDNCMGAVDVEFFFASDTTYNNCYSQVTYIYVASDTCGNRSFCSYNIDIYDFTAPEITSPEDVTFECDEEIIWGEASATDNCQAEVILSEGEPEYVQDECGYHIIRTWSATDGCDNWSYASQTIWITDTTPPVFEEFETQIWVECEEVETVVPGATDNCDESVEVTYEDETASGGCLGTIIRVFTATDDCGNTATATQYIYVQDTTPPTIDEPGDMTAECSDVPEAPGADGAEVWDNCGMEVTVEFHTEMMEGPCADSYTILWIWDAMDYCENVSSDTTVITVVDTTNPELSVPQGGTFSCDEEIIYGDASATDNCDAEVEITWSDEMADGECPQEYSVIRTWVATDNCGNWSTASATYWVVDEEAPEFTSVPENITIECDDDIPATSAVAEDNCGEVSITSDDAYYIQTTCYTVIIRTFTAMDECGNWSTASHTITILDTTPPVIEYEVEIERPCDDYDGIFATATDNCDEEVEVMWINDELASGGCQGRIIRTYGAWDDCQNYSEVQQFITLTDEVDPIVLEQTPDQTVECGDEMPSVNVWFDDNCDDELDIVSGVVMTSDSCTTIYTYTFTATDNCDNSTSSNVVITVTDTQNPWFESLPENSTIACDDEVPAIETPTALDLCDEDVDVEVTDDIMPGECPNEYTIARVYRAYDDCGNQVVETRYIYVVDEEAPMFDEQENEFAYECDDDIEVVTATATDNCGDVTYDYTDTWYNESDCFGYLIRVWSATDDCSNTSYFTQYISIYDETAPVITGEFEITMPCDDISGEIFVTATDNCDDDVEISIFSDEIASGGCAGRIIRTYHAWDNCENMTEFVQFITLTDTIAPIASMDPQDASYECDDLWLPAMVTFTDNCTEELSYFPEFWVEDDGCTQVYHYVWTAVDNCNNSTTVDQVITVTDTTAPTASEPQDMTIECGTFWDIVVPFFSDNCDDTLSYDSGSNTETIECNTVITFWWSATDDCNNTTTIDWVVTIEDTTPPVLEVPQGGDFSCDEDIVYGDAAAVDVCDESVEVTYTDELVAGDCPQSYTIIRTWVAVDDCNNMATAQAWYNVTDDVAPWFESTPEDMTLECSDEIPASEATAMDNCDEVVDVTQSDAIYYSSDCYTIIVRTFVATDDCDNSSSTTQWFYIYDTTAPVITGEFEIEMPCDSISYGIFVTATDNCDDDVYIEVVSDELASGGCAGRIIRTYRAWDNCQNWSEFVQFITLTDDTAPVASVDPEDINVECGDEWSAAEVTFTDNCDESLVLTPDVFWTVDSCTTTYHYIWTATDHCNNSTTVDQWITITDTTAPTLYDEDSEFTVACNVIVDLVLPDAWDACDEEVDVTASYETLPGECPGEYTEMIVFTATDDCGHSTSATHIIHHVDEEAPMLENIPEGGSYECDETLPNDQPTAFDYCSEATVMSETNIIDGDCPNNYTVVVSFWAVDECGNSSDAVEVSYYVYDETAPTFDNSVSDEDYECLDWETYVAQSVTASDNCGEAAVDYFIYELESDECGNGWWQVYYTASDLCDNTSNLYYYIHIQDTTDPILSEMPESLMLDCDDELPVAPEVTATDNCDNEVFVSYTETCVGDCPEEGDADCELKTPVLPTDNPCIYPYDWAMALFSMPDHYRWYELHPNYGGSLTHNGDGSITISGVLRNVEDTLGGFTFYVTFANEMDWAAWSSQAFPTGFKADCGGEAANHESWMYYILQAGDGAELVGWGTYAGSALDMVHAPSNHYFGFQMGDGANNYNGENGFGGWFTYHGIFLDNGQPIMSGLAGGVGDLAFEVDCCPDYQIVRCWTAVDCSGNETSWCQTITFGDLEIDAPSAPTVDFIEADRAGIAIVNIMPNPANERSQISFMSKEAGRLSLQILDMTGRVVADLYNNNVEGGIVYKADFDTDRIPNGMYMVRLNSGSESDIDRIQVAK